MVKIMSITVEKFIDSLRPTMQINIVDGEGNVLTSFMKVAYKAQYSDSEIKDINYEGEDRLSVMVGN